ncbi:nucleotidyltransferase family protein [Mesobacterium sp. TK19101]|uniref:Nucleotidyltransferase family protein n=1 Tax=Mesobacterium hydrothermale TaxID=3111907 RepID=A0ABU6HI88_9RHOB|nr:nucleotidyltransferase family protein [Mesobacterium sp. TK19101]MEC3861158.1 nucleotidyltransferase family protein [Mesobacterium sp. TK19101]
MNTATILIPAAGNSSRMRGADKLLQTVDGIPLLRRQVVRALSVAPVVVTVPAGRHPRYAALDGLALTLLPVPDAAEGMAASLRRGIQSLPPQATGAMIVPGDMPDLSEQDLSRIINAHYDKPDAIIQATAADGTPGHPVLFPRALFSHFGRLSGDEGARAILRDNRDLVQRVALPGKHALTDLDTPEDWDNWRARSEN